MKRYLVGGAVRDEILGRRIGDRDWVVIGATEAEMLDRGFIRVGKSFPVFLHPDTREEHALARLEVKTGRGHKAFNVETEGVDLETDLRRRDLTINAIAKDEAGNLIDPFEGYRDLKDGILRHVSPLFAADPLRAYRVARLAAELPNFRVARETVELMRSMSDELSALSDERVWAEFERAANAEQPARFFEIIAEAQIEGRWFRRLDLCGLADLIRERRLSGDSVFGAIGWLHNPDVVRETLETMRCPAIPMALACDISRHGRLVESLMKPESAIKLEPQRVLETFIRMHAFRPGERADRMLAVLERIMAVSVDPVRDLIARLAAVSGDASPGPQFGKSVERKRIILLKDAISDQLRAVHPTTLGH